MRIRVKICGITTREAVLAAVDAGVDALGFVFAQSPRRVEIDQALELISDLPVFVTTVAVFRLPTPAEVAEVVSRFHPHLVQAEPDPALIARLDGRSGFLPVLHDDLDLPARAAQSRDASAVLLEAAGPGGRGIPPSWERAAELARLRPLILAGGLGTENLGRAVRQVRPFGVDVSSGVESRRGVKDPDKIVGFVEALRKIESELSNESEIKR